MDLKPLTKERANIRVNKKAFQYDAYRPLFWSGKGSGVEADPPVNRMTDTCENITLPKLRLRVVWIKNNGQLVTVRL